MKTRAWGSKRPFGGLREGCHELVDAPIVVDDVALFGARDVYDVAPAVLGAHLVGPGSAVELVLAGARVRSTPPDRAPLPDLNGSFVFP